MPGISIVICTCNRATSLARTLAAIDRVEVPGGMACEVLVVDNGSNDDTAAVVRSARLNAPLTLRYLNEPRRGQSRARNTGLAAAAGEIIVFTDDDVLPAADWLVRLCAPILAGTADAVAGNVRLAPHLERPWMSSYHRAWLAGTEILDENNPSRMVGANMAFSREVLARVPAFDPELGPGAIGFGDDTLFSLQVREAGYRLVAAFDAIVEHHFEESRLHRPHWIEAARKMGRTDAYLAYHWDNSDWTRPGRNAFSAAVRRLFQGLTWIWSRGVPESVLNTTRNLHANLSYLRERQRPRNYTRRGLVKQAAA
jgi:glycosyltransferase involved in cell wall biosynthesis